MINIYLIIINIITFILYGIDKIFAIKNMWRISEKTLIYFAILGGALGAILGMYLFRHKTKTPKFLITIPLLCIIEAYLYLKFY